MKIFLASTAAAAALVLAVGCSHTKTESVARDTYSAPAPVTTNQEIVTTTSNEVVTTAPEPVAVAPAPEPVSQPAPVSAAPDMSGERVAKADRG